MECNCDKKECKNKCEPDAFKFDETDPFEVDLENQIHDIEGATDAWAKDKEFPPNVCRASILCNDAEIEGITYALFKYRAAKSAGFRLRESPNELLTSVAKSAHQMERERWELAMAHCHSTFQKKINYYKLMVGRLMAKLSKRKKTARLHHNLHEMMKAEIGKENFIKLLRQASEVTEWELAVADWHPPAGNCSVCGHGYEEHYDDGGKRSGGCKKCTWGQCKWGMAGYGSNSSDKWTCICGHHMNIHKNIAGFSPPTHACESCTWEKCDDFTSKESVRKLFKPGEKK